MTRTWMGVVALFFAVSAHAAQLNLKTVSIDTNSVKVSPTTNKFGSFAQIKVDGLETTKQVGQPEVPVKSYLLQGRPEEITVNVNVRQDQLLENTRPAPAQPEKCRCATDQRKPYAFNAESYSATQQPYTLTYVGAFRGTPITRLDVPLATYDPQSNGTTVHSQVEVTTNAVDFDFQSGDYKDYLIIVPEKLAAGIDDFVTYKKAQGYNVEVEKVLSPANTTAALQSTIKDHYKSGTDFVIIVGDDVMIPMQKVDTSGSSQTPSDLYLFTMDGADDHVPDMFYSRIAATTVSDVKAELAKSMEYERRTAGRANLGKVIGVASNQGYDTTDKDYITAILGEFTKGLGVGQLFLYEDNADSNPTTLNKQFGEGAFWMTYVGHGSGFGWPSFNVAYDVSDIAKINNKDSIKPVIIDVACMNGRLSNGYLGTTWMKVNGNSGGAAAYLGGTVNISWHPPAIMARGIATEHMAKHFHTLGEAILAGQLVLAKTWTNQAEVIDNFEWYHLQGDPGMSIKF